MIRLKGLQVFEVGRFFHVLLRIRLRQPLLNLLRKPFAAFEVGLDVRQSGLQVSQFEVKLVAVLFFLVGAFVWSVLFDWEVLH